MKIETTANWMTTWIPVSDSWPSKEVIQPVLNFWNESREGPMEIVIRFTNTGEELIYRKVEDGTDT